MEDFNTWLENKIKTKPNSKFYDPNGSSSRAVITRGVCGEFKKNLKEFIPKTYRDFKFNWDGWDTSVAWFLQVVIFPFLFPIMPFAWTYSNYRRAIKEFRAEYESEIAKHS